MTIISIKFLVFVIGLLFLYYVLPKKIRWVVLLLGSVIFYYLNSKKLTLFILLSVISIFTTGLVIDKYNGKIKEAKDSSIKKKFKSRKKLILILSIAFNILLIVLTKYFAFTLNNINGILGFLNIPKINTSFKLLIPLGISYYTLEAISYITDIYREKYNASKNIFKVALYLLYFPKIVEGPISKFNELSKEFYENNELDFNNFLIGLDLIIFGLFKKLVIADRAGIFVNNVFSGNYGGLTVIMAIILYTLQIYAEFSGCIDIVRGVSLLFGVKLPVNFKRPFFSKDIQEFWRRWHISLGTWLKEYVFYSISFSKMNMKLITFSKKHFNNYIYHFISAAFPLLFVWLVNGIWHGASYKYVVYGMYYYVLMMIGILLTPLLKKIKINVKILDFIHIIRTIIIVMIGMTLFRAESISHFGSIICSIFKSGNGLSNFGLVKIDFIILIISCIILLVIGLLEEFKKINIDDGFTNKVIVRSIIYTILICSIIILGIYGEGYDASNFIYGAF